jgi:hypothetical protein
MHRSGVVDLREFEGKIRILPGAFGVAEQTECDHGDVNVAAREGKIKEFTACES